ncbi:MAG: ABC transporter substrate-binding protein [Bacteroidota bacterium]
MKKQIIALDWTPNINHIGFFVAQEKGFYAEQQLEVELVDPSVDNYQMTPAKKLELGQAHFALCPMESVISYRTKATPFDCIAVAALLQNDLSAIVVNSSDAIQSPKDLDGKTYASYKARYEDEIVRQMIRNDGGQGNIVVEYPAKLGIWDTVLSDHCDATWIFMNWEGVEAEGKNIPLRYFKMSDYGIPYSYSPVIATHESALQTDREVYKNCLSAVKKGYLYSQQHPEEAIELLRKWVPESEQHIDLSAALALSAPAFGNEETWGKMKEENVSTFLAWLAERKLETQPLTLSELVTNELF